MRHLKMALAFLVLAFLGFASAEAYETGLSSQAIREAYFLGQRKDDRTAEFLSRYIQRFPLPRSGAHVSEVEILTPYAQTVQLSMRRTIGYSAQQAEQDYHGHANSLRVRVELRFTPTYALQAAVSSSRKATGNSGFRLRAEDFWRDFTFRITQPQDGEERLLEPFATWGEPYYVYPAGGTAVLDGADIWLVFDAADVTSDALNIDVRRPDGQHIEAMFDLAKLR